MVIAVGEALRRQFVQELVPSVRGEQRGVVRQDFPPVFRQGLERPDTRTKQTHEADHAGAGQPSQEDFGERRGKLPSLGCKCRPPVNEVDRQPRGARQSQHVVVPRRR